MKKEQKVDLKHYEEQLRWCKEQDDILEKIKTALFEMKEIAQYATENELTPLEMKKLQAEIDQLKEEVATLEKQLSPSQIIH